MGGQAAMNFQKIALGNGGFLFAGQAAVSYYVVGQVDESKPWYRLGLGF
jgi:hypothetical protein